MLSVKSSNISTNLSYKVEFNLLIMVKWYSYLLNIGYYQKVVLIFFFKTASAWYLMNQLMGEEGRGGVGTKYVS